jgi:hypothetical protein
MANMTITPYRFIPVLLLGLTIPAVAKSGQGGAQPTAQGQNPCALLTIEEVQSLAPKEQHVTQGVAAANQDIGSATCRYTWGAGVDRYALVVSVNPAPRTFVGMTPDAIKQALVSSVVPETDDSVITDVGNAAVFKSYSRVYAGASAYLKDRILQVQLDGFDAPEHKGGLISLLKSAVSRM